VGTAQFHKDKVNNGSEIDLMKTLSEMWQAGSPTKAVNAGNLEG